MQLARVRERAHDNEGEAAGERSARIVDSVTPTSNALPVHQYMAVRDIAHCADG
jgi:hypothetical protein